MTTTNATYRKLTAPIYCVTLSGCQELDEGELQPGALVRKITEWDEYQFNLGNPPRWAKPETWTFEASTDGGKTWYRQRAWEAPQASYTE